MIVAQISDTHITTADAPQAAALARTVAHLLALPARPDVVILSGDCTDNGRPEAYALLRELLRPLTMPVYVILGNHDNRAELLAAFGPQGSAPLDGYAQYVVEAGLLRLIALDTNVPNAGGGALATAQLEWLDARLSEAPDQPTLIFMHHPPFLTGLAPFDAIGLADADAFAAVIARHPQVERVVAGHVHSTMTRRFAGTVAMTCPATSYQLLLDFAQPARVVGVMEQPACLIHTWDVAAGLLSSVSQVGPHAAPVTLHDGERWQG